jgi:ABC-type transport system involved in cytochrome c biogenesis permease subunit
VLVLLKLLNVVLPLGYLLVVLNYLVYFVSKNDLSRDTVTPLARAVVTLHLLYLAVTTATFRHVPLANVWEAFSLVAFALAAVYLILEWRLQDKATGVFLLAPALFFQIVSSAFVTHSAQVNPILRSSWFGIHVTTALLGYAAFAIAAVYGTLYLMLYRQLKGSRIGLIFQRLPNLESLSGLNLHALLFGWSALTLAILFGIIWSSALLASGELEVNLLADPKFLSTVFIWVVYGICVGGRYLFRWPSRMLGYISLAAFLLMLASSMAVSLFFSSFHSFT